MVCDFFPRRRLFRVGADMSEILRIRVEVEWGDQSTRTVLSGASRGHRYDLPLGCDAETIRNLIRRDVSAMGGDLAQSVFVAIESKVSP